MQPSITNPYDLIILGAGMVGSALALALNNSGLRVALVDRQPLFLTEPDGNDLRNLVLSLSSQRILSALELWPKLTCLAHPIDTVHVTEAGQCQRVVMRAEQCGLDAMAYSIPAPILAQTLHRSVDAQTTVDVFCPADIDQVNPDLNDVTVTIEHQGQALELTTKLLVLATGTDCQLRDQLGFHTERKAYGQQAIVGNLSTERFLAHTAFERFSPDGPFALLPADGHYGVVCVAPDQAVEELMARQEQDLIEYLQQRLGRRLGRILSLGKRRAYPLEYLYAEQPYRQRVLLLGNAAHTLHPNGAQGFNLALRDVAQLAEELIQAHQQQQDIGQYNVLEPYIQKREADQQRVMSFSDGLTKLFYNNDFSKRKSRKLLMAASEYIWPFKHALMHRAMGIYGQQADMVKPIKS